MIGGLMIDQDAELKRFKWLLGAGLSFLISGYFSYDEMKYAIWGKTAEAHVYEARETIRSSLRSPPMVSLKYTFTESDGTPRSEFDSIPANSPFAQLQTVTVQYLPGVEKSSRIAGRVRLMAILFFCGSVVWLAGSIIGLVREANRPIARGPGRRGR
jgi:hypothetical protein